MELEAEKKSLEHLKYEEELERQRKLDQKNRLYNNAIDDLNNFNRRKELDNLRKAADDEKNKKLMDEQNQKMLIPYQRYRDQLANANDRIYNNAYKYNGILGNPIDQNAFGTRNDFVFNKNIAMQHEREKDELRRNPQGVDERLRNMEKEKELEAKLHQDKLDNQKLYKEYLDNQNEVKNLSKLNAPTEDSRPMLLMPAYFYPNRPVPLYKKAKDSLLFSKNPDNYFDQDMNKFFHWDSQYNTLMDYPNDRKYLGDSRLRHNPITCPVNDYYYNKYVNRLKKNSEYVPPQINKSQPEMKRNDGM